MHSDTHWHTDRHAGNKVASENESWKWEQACSCEVRSDRRGWRPMTVSFRTSVPDCCVSAAHIRCWAGLRFFREGYKCIYISSILLARKKLLGANRFFLSPPPAQIQTLTFSERDHHTSRLRRVVKKKEERNSIPPVLKVFPISFERSPTAGPTG